MLRSSLVRLNRQHFRAVVGITNEALDKRTKPKPFDEIPGVKSVPILGSTWAYLPYIGKYDFKRIHLVGMAKYKEYGKVVREHFGSMRVVELYDAKDIETMYRVEGKYPERMVLQCILKYRSQRKDVYNNGGILMVNGEEWYRIRSQVQPHMMKPKTILAHVTSMDSVAKDFVNCLAEIGAKNDGKVNDTLQELYKWALESLGLVALDTRLGCLEAQPNPEALAMIKTATEGSDLIMRLEFRPPPLWKYFDTPLYKKFSKLLDAFCDTTHKYLRQAHERLLSAPEDHEPTFLEALLSTTKDPRDITCMITDMFLGGIDSTATALAFTLYHLARNQECQEKAHNEIKRVLNQDEVTSETLSNIPYLKACVKESLRLTPVVNGTSRTLLEDTVLGGYHVPAGTIVVLNTRVAGMLESNFHNPESFYPERFLRDQSSESVITHKHFAFLPFSFGPRSCVGRRIAEQEIWILLIRILQRFRVRFEEKELDLVTRLVNTPAKPMCFRFQRRN